MAEDEKVKLEIALKLKRALENDLKRLGKYTPKEKKETRTRYVPQRRKRPVTLDFSKVNNLRDIDEQDYDAPDADLAIALRKAMFSANLERRMTLQIVMNVINNACDEVERQLEGVKNPKLLYNLWECKLFEGKASVATAFNAVREHLAHPLALLYLAEVLLFGYEAPNMAEKVLQMLFESTNDPRIGFLLAMYRGEREIASEHISNLTRTNRFRDAIPIYLLLRFADQGDESKIESLEKVVKERKHNACAMAALAMERMARGEFKLQSLKELSDQFPYCRFINGLLAWAEALEGEVPNLSRVDEPARLKIQIATAVNEGDSDTVKRLTSKLAEMFGGFRLVVGVRDGKVEHKGIPLREEMKQTVKIDVGDAIDISKVMRRIAEEKHVDISRIDYAIETPEVEFLRLVWGWRVCQRA